MGAKVWNQWLHQHWVSSFMILFQAFTLNQPFTQYSPSFSWVPFEVCFGSLSTHCVLLSTQQSNFAALGWIWAEGLASKCSIVQNVDCSESSLSACGTGYLCFTRLHSSRTCLAFLGSLGSDWHNLIKRWAWGSMQTPTADFKWTLNNKNNHSSTISAISVCFLYSTGQWSTNLCIFSFVVFLTGIMKCLPSGEFSIVGFLVWKVFLLLKWLKQSCDHPPWLWSISLRLCPSYLSVDLFILTAAFNTLLVHSNSF